MFYKSFSVISIMAVVAAILPAQQRQTGPAKPLYDLEESYLRWRLAPEDQGYASIQGEHLKQYVADLTAISRRYRDNGHPQFWGRIIGTEADTENAKWVQQQFQKIGLSEVRQEEHPLPPQWIPKSWKVEAASAGKTLNVSSAQPAYLTGATAGELNLPLVYVGLGSDADLAGRDVRGKAAVIFSMPYPGSWRHSATVEGSIKRVEDQGAAAILVVVAMPGNVRSQFYPTGGKAPTFSVGMDDGIALRDMIGQAGAETPHLKVRLDVDLTPNLKTATVWGTLPGSTDETVFIVAHRDGWFEAANDNASGVATMLGLAEYFAKIPKAQRKRTIHFLGTSGHHNGGAASGTWLLEHKDVFNKTALIINCEHTGAGEEILYAGGGPAKLRKANWYDAFTWYVGGSHKLEQIVVKSYDSFGVPTFAEPERSPAGEIGRIYQLAPSIQVIDAGPYFHTDYETLDTVSPRGIEAVTRAYAKIIVELNKVDLGDIQRPEQAQR